MENNSSHFSFNYEGNPFNINFIVDNFNPIEVQHPIENNIQQSHQEDDFIEFEVNSFVNIDPTENSEEDTVGYTKNVETIEVLIESYRYSREEITKKIKSCNYLLTQRGYTASRVYWTGQIFHEIRRMLTEIVGLEQRSELAVDAEADIFTLSRENFINNLFWTKIDLKLFNDQQSKKTITITYDEFEFIKKHHENFLEKNNDLIGKNFKSRIGNTRSTPKAVVDAYIFFYYVDELFR
jgi:hypothetical protein